MTYMFLILIVVESALSLYPKNARYELDKSSDARLNVKTETYFDI